MPIRVAFPGSSCHPQSPIKVDEDPDVKYDYDNVYDFRKKKYDHSSNLMIDDNDQLIKICNRKLETIDTSFLNEAS